MRWDQLLTEGDLAAARAGLSSRSPGYGAGTAPRLPPADPVEVLNRGAERRRREAVLGRTASGNVGNVDSDAVGVSEARSQALAWLLGDTPGHFDVRVPRPRLAPAEDPRVADVEEQVEEALRLRSVGVEHEQAQLVEDAEEHLEELQERFGRFVDGDSEAWREVVMRAYSRAQTVAEAGMSARVRQRVEEADRLVMATSAACDCGGEDCHAGCGSARAMAIRHGERAELSAVREAAAQRLPRKWEQERRKG